MSLARQSKQGFNHRPRLTLSAAGLNDGLSNQRGLYPYGFPRLIFPNHHLKTHLIVVTELDGFDVD